MVGTCRRQLVVQAWVPVLLALVACAALLSQSTSATGQGDDVASDTGSQHAADQLEGETGVVGQEKETTTFWDTIESIDHTTYEALTKAADKGDSDAQATLAAVILLASPTKTGATRDLKQAVALASSAAEDGNPTAQFLLGFMYASGVGLDADQAKAVLYYTFAALGDSPFAQLALAFRYSQGVSLKKNCEVALNHYRSVAAIVEQGVTLHGGHVIVRKRIPLVGKDDAQVSETDVIQYYQYNADRGDRASQLMMGRLYLSGHGVAQNYGRAFRYLRMAANAGDANAMAYMGEMYSHGLGVEGDNKTAVDYFKRSATKTSAVGQNHLATMHLHGIEVPKDDKKAYQLYLQAAQQGLADAQHNLATMYYNGIGTKVDYTLALKYFKLAAQQGNVLAINSLASMHAAGIGLPRDCELAAGLYKNVAERAKWMTAFQTAYTGYEEERYDDAVLLYLWLGEMGVEIAQHNAAQILEKGTSTVFAGPTNDTYRRALHNWRRSAGQGQVVARVKVGDYHYYGYGVEANAELAASQYRLAADANDAQATFNLGIMHHIGDGLNRDLYLAKRYYDMARAASADAELPVLLALTWLYGCFAWDYLSTHALPAAVTAVKEWDAEDIETFVRANRTPLLAGLTLLLVVVYLARTRAVHEHRMREEAQQRQEAARVDDGDEPQGREDAEQEGARDEAAGETQAGNDNQGRDTDREQQQQQQQRDGDE